MLKGLSRLGGGCRAALRVTRTSGERNFVRGAAGRLPALTKDRYPHVQRGRFAELGSEHLQFFRGMLGERALTDPADCEGYNVDWIRSVRGYSSCVLKPKTTEEVSKILEYCNQHKIAVCPQGGNTGLVGGSVPVFDEVIISLSLMNKIINIDDISGYVVCEAGCVLENLSETLEKQGLCMPLDLGAKGTCQIGGNVSTNAGGLRLLRYGNLHGSVLGLEAVKANGEVVDCLNTLKKDNTGYHLKHLFIGSEGTLGIVTKVAISCPQKPKAVNMAFLGLESFEKVLETFKAAKKDLGEILSSFELIDIQSLDVVTGHLKVKCPIGNFPFYVLIETQGSNNTHDEEKLNLFLDDVMRSGMILDGTVTNEPNDVNFLPKLELQSAKDKAGSVCTTRDLCFTILSLSNDGSKSLRRINGAVLWELRERITEGLLHDGYLFKYDLSIPIKKFYDIVGIMEEKVGKDCVRVSGFGHIGDSNIHLNVCVKEFSPEVLKKVEPFVYEYTSELKGSVSAEHGVGFRKPKYIHLSKTPTAISLMKDIKKLMDPNGILNPYKVIP